MNSTGWTDRRVWMAAMAMALGAGVAAADLTLSASAYLNSSGQLVSDSGGAVLLTATSGTGATNDPFVLDVSGNLAMGSYTIRGSTNNAQNQNAATWRVTGNVTGTGNFDSYTTQNSTRGGHVSVEAGGSIALNRVYTRQKYGTPINAGSVYLWATGTVTVAGWIDTRAGGGGSVAGSVTIRSEGPVSGQGISIQGTTVGDGSTTNSILTEAFYNTYKGGAGGAVSLYCQTNIVLAGGIATRGFPSGAVVIRGSLTDPSARAGTVTVGAGIRTDPREYLNTGAGGNVTVKAINLQVAGGIDAHSGVNLRRSGSVDIDVTENATIQGYIDTRISAYPGSPGYVRIAGRHIAVQGTDTNGYSIRTWPGVFAGAGSSGSVPGDADVTLTNVDTSAEIYDPANPTNSRTSSIYVAGKIEAGRWYNDNAMGSIRISAVEVQLGGSVIHTNLPAGGGGTPTLAVRYGVTTYGIVTHLVENGVRWNGSSGHNIAYTTYNGAYTFSADVPYAGVLRPSGTMIRIR